MKATDDQRLGIEEMARESDRIVNLILYTSLPRVDIEIQIENFREDCLRRYPGCDILFEMIYAARFRRIWDQWLKERPRQDESATSAWEE
jgi:hypothetical protein